MRLLCWLFGCRYEEHIGGGWCQRCGVDYRQIYKAGKLNAIRRLVEEISEMIVPEEKSN